MSDEQQAHEQWEDEPFQEQRVDESIQGQQDEPSVANTTAQVPIWKRWWFWVIIIVAVVGIVMLVTQGGNGIDVQEERLITDVSLETVSGNNLFPVLAVTVKNTSSVTKRVSFEVNFYADGELFGAGYADYVTLAPGDTATLKAQSDHGYVAWAQKEYTYKITEWHVFDQ